MVTFMVGMIGMVAGWFIVSTAAVGPVDEWAVLVVG